jgi:hypothetical protein
MAHGRHRRKSLNKQDVGEARKAAQAIQDRGLTAEFRHGFDSLDEPFSRMACDHPEACSCDSDYPGWRPGQR